MNPPRKKVPAAKDTRIAKATLRQQRTLETLLAHHVDRDKAFTRALENFRTARRSGLSAEDLVKQVDQFVFELDTALAVARRHHELAMQQLQLVERFPDEDADA